KDKAAIFDAHLMMLDDPELIGAVIGQIENDKVNAEYALKSTVDMFIGIFEQMDNEYMRERAADIKDIGGRISNILLGISDISLGEISEKCIVVAKDLTPSDTAQMDRNMVLGFVTDVGGRTSHSAIMARTLEIPAVVGTQNGTINIKNGDFVILDGDNGVVIINPEGKIIDEYNKKIDEIIKHKNELVIYKDAESITLDGRLVELAANIGSPKDIAAVLKNGAEGIGLFRTEFLYMDRDTMPTEEEQFQSYKEVLEGMKNKPVIIRTLDIGGDKKLSYLPIGEEMNPFLGYRAIRICLDRIDIFKIQLRALYRASIYGKLKIMFPMISGLQEILSAKEIIEEVKQELRNEGIAYSDEVQVGIMIEIPSAAVTSDILAKHVDFFSIGTNDLVQYSLAVDRMNEKISHMYDPYNPAVLRLIKMVIDNGHKEGIMVGMCGEMAGDQGAISVLLGLGLDEFSMSAASVLNARKLVRGLNYEKAQEIGDKVLNLSTSVEIKEYINKML
ncbi:MAG: ptsP, partial [Clostridiales bacterium]|nr:ptsP [Clostridiales bacterium]